MAYRKPLQTLYRIESPVLLTTELICDMALIEMMPLMARFVWLLTVNPSAEDLHQPLSVISCLSTHRNHTLIRKKQSGIYQIVGPGSQQWILSESISPCQEEIESLAYISTYEASVSTCTCVGISHNQHIPRFYEKELINNAQIDYQKYRRSTP